MIDPNPELTDAHRVNRLLAEIAERDEVYQDAGFGEYSYPMALSWVVGRHSRGGLDTDHVMKLDALYQARIRREREVPNV